MSCKPAVIGRSLRTCEIVPIPLGQRRDLSTDSGSIRSVDDQGLDNGKVNIPVLELLPHSCDVRVIPEPLSSQDPRRQVASILIKSVLEVLSGRRPASQFRSVFDAESWLELKRWHQVRLWAESRIESIRLVAVSEERAFCYFRIIITGQDSPHPRPRRRSASPLPQSSGQAPGNPAPQRPIPRSLAGTAVLRVVDDNWVCRGFTILGTPSLIGGDSN